MKILILGGSLFVGKSFANLIKQKCPAAKIYLANRGLSGECDIQIDRNLEESCKLLKNSTYDVVVDFSCYDLNQMRNTFQNLHFNKYIFISSSAVEALPLFNVGPQDYEMARYAMNKKACEDFIINNVEDYSIIRPCYIVGDNDYTNRFLKTSEGKYLWKSDGVELTYYIEVERLSEIIFSHFSEKNSIVNPCL